MGAHESVRLALNLSVDRHQLDGAWWPRSRVLTDELPALLAAWPVEDGYISRIVYSPLDWEDRPSAVPIPNRRGQLKTVNFPPDDSHQLLLTMLNGQRRSLVVIPPSASEEAAVRYLGHFDSRYRSPGDAVSTTSQT
jgi:hypothetical protein